MSTTKRATAKPSPGGRKFYRVRGTPAQRQKNQPALDLLRRWQHEDAAMSPEQREQAQRDWQEFRRAMNADRDRAGARRVYRD
jgi:hypothetical protein